MVADHIGTRHYSFTFTVQQGIDVLTDVIHHLETFDVTTIRASTPMFLLAREANKSCQWFMLITLNLDGSICHEIPRHN